MLRIVRKWNRPDYCIGKLYLDNKYVCDTLEDTDRGLHQQMSEAEIKAKKVYGKTAIPVGTYKVDMTTSPKFANRVWGKRYNGKVPQLLNVPGFSGVRIHPLNTAEDSLGCIGLGENKIKGKIINSTITYYKVLDSYIVPLIKKYGHVIMRIEREFHV